MMIDINKASEKMRDLSMWAEDLVFPGKFKDFIKEIKGFNLDGAVHREFCFYTESNRYKIYAIDRKEDDGYLSCQVTARKARAGEDWFRGNDLPDGPFTIETWNKILECIVKYELVQLTEYKRPDRIPKD
jgi:hypothetical protein